MKKILRSAEQLLLQDMLKSARHDAGLTQEALGSMLGKPQSFVAKYEGGERLLNVVEFVYVLRALGQDPKKFFATFDRQVP